MYEERFIAFVDILGFGKLVESSAIAPDVVQQILDALMSIHPDKIRDEMPFTINHDKVPAEEMEQLLRDLRRAAAAMRLLCPVAVHYFSDSLVISAPASNPMASQMVLDLLTKLSTMMWMSHKLLLRGGVTVGPLVHVENGPMFGPAMNRAYKLESKLAVAPRFLIDRHCIERYREVETFGLFESFIQKEDGDFFYASLATAFRHIINDSAQSLLSEDFLKPFRSAMLSAPEEIERLAVKFKDEAEILKKYVWLANEFSARIPEVRAAYPSQE
ncbi:hypothetical protein [Pseudomonas syringae]|uniref:hypothetical protein n=1 Tax=Pseudomonas syringae TaxID=317 RepID=UPI00040A39B5|nr:hypothetical protein [Pseudomonas syringae]